MRYIATTAVLIFSICSIASANCISVERTDIKRTLVKRENCKAQVEGELGAYNIFGWRPTLVYYNVFEVEQLVTIRDICEKKTIEQYKEVSKEKSRIIVRGSELEVDGDKALREAKNTCREILNN